MYVCGVNPDIQFFILNDMIESILKNYLKNSKLQSQCLVPIKNCTKEATMDINSLEYAWINKKEEITCPKCSNHTFTLAQLAPFITLKHLENSLTCFNKSQFSNESLIGKGASGTILKSVVNSDSFNGIVAVKEFHVNQEVKYLESKSWRFNFFIFYFFIFLFFYLFFIFYYFIFIFI